MKRIMSALLLTVFLAISMISCGGYVTVTLPPKDGAEQNLNSPSTGERTTVSDLTSVTDLPPESVLTTVPDDTLMIETEDPVPAETCCYSPFRIILGGPEMMWASASPFGDGFECMPLSSNNELWCPAAFWHFAVVAEENFTENVEHPSDYEYQWYIWFKDIKLPNEYEYWSERTPCKVESYYDFGNGNILYRLQTDIDLENGPSQYFEIGHTYEVIVQVERGFSENCGFAYLSFIWNEKLDAQYKFYKYFWSTRDRSKGYTAGSWEYTDADIEYAESIGFKYDEIEKNLYYVKETN